MEGLCKYSPFFGSGLGLLNKNKPNVDSSCIWNYCEEDIRAEGNILYETTQLLEPSGKLP